MAHWWSLKVKFVWLYLRSQIFTASSLFFILGEATRIMLRFLAVADIGCLLTNFIFSVIPHLTSPNWFVVSKNTWYDLDCWKQWWYGWLPCLYWGESYPLSNTGPRTHCTQTTPTKISYSQRGREGFSDCVWGVQDHMEPSVFLFPLHSARTWLEWVAHPNGSEMTACAENRSWFSLSGVLTLKHWTTPEFLVILECSWMSCSARTYKIQELYVFTPTWKWGLSVVICYAIFS